MAELIELRCRNCGAQLEPASISAELAAARCPHCDALFALPVALRDGGGTAASRGPRREVAMPPRFDVRKSGRELEITRRWFRPALFAALVFCIFWNGFMLVWHGIAISQGVWLMSAFGLIHTAVGLGIAYATAAGFLNRTTVTVSGDTLSVRHGPLPWPGSKSVAAGSIRQIFCKEKTRHGKHGPRTRYEIHFTDDRGRSHEFIKGLEEPEQALFIEQQVEKRLGIEDAAVAGEIAR